jgi:hypothetical protein
MNALVVSEAIPFIEYDLHRQLLNKLRVHGMNAAFGLRTQVGAQAPPDRPDGVYCVTVPQRAIGPGVCECELSRTAASALIADLPKALAVGRRTGSAAASALIALAVGRRNGSAAASESRMCCWCARARAWDRQRSLTAACPSVV